MVDGDAEEQLVGRARTALRDVIDPEIGLNVVDLGLIYRVHAEEGRLSVTMTVTSPACPLGEHMKAQAETAVRRAVPEVSDIRVELVFDPPWSPDLMSPDAKARLGW